MNKSVDDFEVSSDRAENIRLILEAWTDPIDKDAVSVLGFHGTSLEVLKMALNDGVFFAGSQDFYFWPVDDRYADPRIEYQNPFEQAQELATDNAHCHAYGLSQRPDLIELEQVTRRRVMGTFGELWELADFKAYDSRGGFVLQLDAALLAQFKVSGEKPFQGDGKIEIPNGLPIKLINGVYPQGLDELRFLKKLTGA